MKDRNWDRGRICFMQIQSLHWILWNRLTFFVQLISWFSYILRSSLGFIQFKMVNSGLKSRKVSFRIPYYTQWGQNVLICGSDRLLGSWNVKKGLLLKPSHQGEELIWSGSIPVPPGYQSEYSYYVVDDRRNILRWEVGKKRKLLLPDGFQDGQSLELHDLWQVLILLPLFLILFFLY